LTWGDRSLQNHIFQFQNSMARTTKTSKKPSAKPTKPTAVSAPKAKPTADFQEVRTLIDLLKKNDLAVLEYEQGDLKVTLKTPAGASGGATLIQGHASAPAAPGTVAAAPVVTEKATAEPAKSNYKEIVSPMVGTFYSSSSPEAPSFVEVGTTINTETVVCIIEAMKVMNEIKAEIAGKVVEVVAESGKPVQFGQVLFRVS
jgi:acetyl-CoA carboxylase biotin carboxyl carrier protein